MEIYKLTNNSMHSIAFQDFKEEQHLKYLLIMEPEELAAHNNFFGFHRSTIDECISSKQHPRLEVYDDVIFGVVNLIDYKEDWFIAKELNFFLRANYLIFVTKEKNKLLEGIKNEVLRNVNSSSNYIVSESKILYMLLDRLTSVDNDMLRKIESKIMNLEEQVIKGIEKDFTIDIIKLRKQLLYLQRHYAPLIDISEGLEENENGLIDENATRYFTILVNRIQRLTNNVAHLRDYLTQVREAYQAQVDIKLNKTMKLFTVVTTIFLPLTLIAGWYGMNFKYMPELGWVMGYPGVIVLSLAVVAVCLAYFKRHHYL